MFYVFILFCNLVSIVRNKFLGISLIFEVAIDCGRILLTILSSPMI